MAVFGKRFLDFYKLFSRISYPTPAIPLTMPGR
jgi:hypothetical protein